MKYINKAPTSIEFIIAEKQICRRRLHDADEIIRQIEVTGSLYSSGSSVNNPHISLKLYHLILNYRKKWLRKVGPTNDKNQKNKNEDK